MTTIAVPARAVAAPVLERLDGGLRGTVLGTGNSIAWAGIEEFVVLVSVGGVPLLPNAVALAGGRGALATVAVGAPASYRPGNLRVGPVVASWDPARPPVWEPRVVPVVGDPGRIRRRGEALLRALGAPPPATGGAGRAGPSGSGETSALISLMALAGVVIATEAEGASAIGTLLDAVANQDAAGAAGAASALCGRGAGLIPEGDDLLAAVLAGLVTLGPAVGVRKPALAAWTGALIPPDTATRTSELARTLLRLAALGRVLEPAGCLLDLTATGERCWPSALTRLLRAGHANGRVYAAGIAATACALTATRRPGLPRRPAGRPGDRRRPPDGRERAGERRGTSASAPTPGGSPGTSLLPGTPRTPLGPGGTPGPSVDDGRSLRQQSRPARRGQGRPRS